MLEQCVPAAKCTGIWFCDRWNCRYRQLQGLKRLSEPPKECPAGASKEEVRTVFHSPPSLGSITPHLCALLIPSQVTCVAQMRELNPSATEKLSGADLQRFSRARKCNAAAAVQVCRGFPRLGPPCTSQVKPRDRLFRSFCWKASSGPVKSTSRTSAAPGRPLPRRLICALLGSTCSTDPSSTAACSW